MNDRDPNKSSSIIANQLTPFAGQPRNSYSTVRPVCQSVVEFRSDGSSNSFLTIRRIVLQWVGNRAGKPLPPQAWQGESFELEDIGSQRTAAISIQEPRYWAARLDDSDRMVPQRSWVTEIGIGDHPGGGILLGSRLLCVTKGEDPSFQPSIQRFLQTVMEQVPDAYVENRRIGTAAWVVETEADVEQLTSLIRSKSRRLDVIVCSLPEGSENPADAIINAHDIHRRTYGAAHVVIITSSASFLLSDYLGKEFSTFRGAVRTYRPGFDASLDEPFRHPLTLAGRISDWTEGGIKGYENFIIGQTLINSAVGRDAEQYFPPFNEVRRVASQLKLEVARQSGSSDMELLSLAEQEIRDLLDTQTNDKETYQGIVDQYERDRDQALEEAQQTRAENINLRHRLRMLDDQLKTQSNNTPTPPLPISLDGFEDWCREHLSGTVEVLNRAVQGAKKSRFEDTAFIYQALIMLRDSYVPMKREGGKERLDAFKAACQELGISEEQTFSGERWGEHGDEYRVRYSGRNCLLERHLKKGNTKDQRYCFRLYFFWDDESEQVVVGWLPSHLDTRAT